MRCRISSVARAWRWRQSPHHLDLMRSFPELFEIAITLARNRRRLSAGMDGVMHQRSSAERLRRDKVSCLVRAFNGHRHFFHVLIGFQGIAGTGGGSLLGSFGTSRFLDRTFGASSLLDAPLGDRFLGGTLLCGRLLCWFGFLLRYGFFGFLFCHVWTPWSRYSGRAVSCRAGSRNGS